MSERSHGFSPYRLAYEGSQAALMASLTRSGDSSVTISRNAKGVAQFEVTVRGDNATACAVRAENLYRDLEAAHPYPQEAPQGPESPQEPPTPIRRPRGRKTA
jgi:hypothetical protein